MITYNSESRTFYLNGKNVTYAFFINDYDYAEHLYYGKTVGEDDLTYTRTTGTNSTTATIPGKDTPNDSMNSYSMFPSELSFFGTGDYREPGVMVTNPAGDRLTELLYDSHEIVAQKPQMAGMPSLTGGETLIVHLKDRVSGFAADLYYTVYENADVVARRIVYKNESDHKIMLNRAYSFVMGLPENKYDIMSLYGGWARERQIDRVPMHHGLFTIDSKRTTSSSELNPFAAVMDHDATETSGEVWGFNLVYSSSWEIKVQGTIEGGTLITGGISSMDFAWNLEAGDIFETPEVVIAYSAEGLGGMSRAFHDVYRDHLINPRYAKAHRPLLINNWEGTYFNFTNDKLKAIVDAVEGTGIDTFVLDDGWFGKRDNDRSGLGDWVVNTTKMEGGLTEIINYVHSKGMKFGLWFEPEMINEDSDLYRAHPDYAIGAPDRPHCYSRHQFVLDLTRKDVRDYIVGAVCKVLDENKIEYVKWDFNRNITESFSVGRAPEQQAEFAHRYVLGLYDLCERIIETHPDVFFEGCAGGGARFDPAITHYFPQIWTSDDSDAEERTYIQYGTSIVYPLSTMSCHVSICPNHQTGRTTPFATRSDIAHLGATGYELDTTTFTDEDRKEVAEQTAEYRRIQDLILTGDLYRIDNPFEGNFFAEAVVAKDKSEALLTCYRRMGRVNNETKRIRMQGLDPEKTYTVLENGIKAKGSTLMQVGLVPAFGKGDFQTVKFTFKAE